MRHPLLTFHELKSRNELHILRKLWHCFGSLFIIYLYNEFETEALIPIFLLSAGIFVSVDLIRLYISRLNRLIITLFGRLMRKNEAHTLTGLSYLLVACVFLLFFGQYDVIMLTLLFVAFADPIASWVGIMSKGEPFVGTKTLEGATAAAATCTLIFAGYSIYHNILVDRLFILAPLVGLLGALAELLPIKRLDDNLTFPILVSLGLTLIFIIYGYL